MTTLWLALSLALSSTVLGLPDSLVSVPLVSRVAPGADVVVPITVSPADGVVSMDFAIDFDPAVVTPTGVYRTAYANPFALSFLPGASRLEIHMTNASPLAGSGEVAWVVFRAVGGVGSSSNLVLSSTSLNGGGIASQVQNGSVSILSVSVHISTPDDAQGSPGTMVMVPISATAFAGVTGIDLAIRFNADVVLAMDVEKTALTNAMSLVFNLSNPGVVNIALFGSTPITGAGELVRVKYDVVGMNGDQTPLNLSRGDMDEGRLSTLLDDGLLTSCTGTDLDADGFTTCAADCDDANPDIHPAAPELCDGLDNDCDPATPDGSEEDWYLVLCDGPDADQCEEGSSVCLDGTQECTDTTGDAVEVCNGLDDDCDGVVDQNVTACDDGNPCTDDRCDGGSGCLNTPNAASCDDGNSCTTGDTCGGGTCNGGTGPNCNDNNSCTTDTCELATGCVHTNNTDACDDDNACTTGDTCGGGTCNGGAGPNCNDNNPCTTDTCELASGCFHSNNTDPCDDSNACTTGDTCGGGTCNGGGGPNCDDNNTCTDDSCDPETGCVNANNTSPCDDGNTCTTGDTCDGGTCNGGAGPNCNDNNPCTTDGCTPAIGCTHNNNTSPCNDGNACTVGDTCGNGTCNGGAPPNCDDGNVCTDDSCNPAGGCVHTNNTTPCSDGNACTTGDACLGGMCRGSGTLDCYDGDSCTTDSCEDAVGCRHVDDPSCTENQPPDCGAAFARPSKLWWPNHRFVPVSILKLTDPDGDQVTATITGVRQDEPISGNGINHESDSRARPGGGSRNRGNGDDAHHRDDDPDDQGRNACPDASGIGTSTALIRAERSAHGNGRVYHVAFSASDGNGGTCTGEVLVCVPHDRGHRRGCVDEGPLFDSTGPCTGH